MKLGITIVALIDHPLTISSTEARLENITINISEAKVRCMARSIAEIIRCRIILEVLPQYEP